MNALIFIYLFGLFTAEASLKVSSSAFKHKGDIPSKYTCEGENISPEITIDDIPKDAKCLALIVDDPDAPGGNYNHWTVWNIPPQINVLKEGSVQGIAGTNSAGENKYKGPCPPSGEHHYFFKVYALDMMLSLPPESDKQALYQAMQGHIIASGELVGMYKKKGK